MPTATAASRCGRSSGSDLHCRPLTLLLVAVALCAAAAAAPAAVARPAPLGQDPIVPGQVYDGDFPDPAVLLVAGTFYAYSTTSDYLNVPELTSTDLRTWRAVPGVPGSPRGDALPRAASWSAGVEDGAGGFHATTWAPSVTWLGPGRYVLAYAAQVAGAPGLHMCLSVATATNPRGPFVDRSTAPLLCPPHGAIDPQVFLAPTGRPWLVWKLDGSPPRLFTQPMNRDASAVLAGAPRRLLARVAQAWEGAVVEDPAMIRFRGRYYLFYSANSFASARYAIGYLICRSWYAGCTRPLDRPLLASGGTIAGPGGPFPFVDRAGRLRLAYHAWRAGNVGYPVSADCRSSALGCAQRRLHVATLRPDLDGLLRVVHRR